MCSVNESSQLVSMNSMVGTQAAIPPCAFDIWKHKENAQKFTGDVAHQTPKLLDFISVSFSFLFVLFCCCWEGGFHRNLNSH